MPRCTNATPSLRKPHWIKLTQEIGLSLLQMRHIPRSVCMGLVIHMMLRPTGTLTEAEAKRFAQVDRQTWQRIRDEVAAMFSIKNGIWSHPLVQAAREALNGSEDPRISTRNVAAQPAEKPRNPPPSESRNQNHDSESPPIPPMRGETPQEPPKASRIKTRSRVPIDEGWKLGLKERVTADEHGMPAEDIEAEFERFKAHHLARGNVMKSWPGAWLTWVLNAKRFRRERAKPPAWMGERLDNAEILRRTLALDTSRQIAGA